jgi:glycosyltransferase A (GT-A) superfamily protein (DUF2064 family)
MSAALVVLMRWPRRGEGKTRLAAQVGAAAAHRLHRAFVADTLAWPAPRPRLLAVSPDAAALLAARAAAPDAVVVPQLHGGLGVRIGGALTAALRSGADRAVLVGTDSPSLPHRCLLECLDSVRHGGACMVRAEDGGFVALAVHGEVARRPGLDWLHGAIAWSTEQAAAQTVAVAARSGVRIETLAERWYDVDGRADLGRLHADLRADPERAPRTLRCLERMALATPAELAS